MLNYFFFKWETIFIVWWEFFSGREWSVCVWINLIFNFDGRNIWQCFFCKRRGHKYIYLDNDNDLTLSVRNKKLISRYCVDVFVNNLLILPFTAISRRKDVLVRQVLLSGKEGVRMDRCSYWQRPQHSSLERPVHSFIFTNQFFLCHGAMKDDLRMKCLVSWPR